jgi:serpin B
MERKLVAFGLLLALSASLLSACGPVVVSPAPAPAGTATPPPASRGDPVSPSGPVRARDAVLAYLAGIYGNEAPGLDLAWKEVPTTSQGLLGSSSFEYTAGDWLVTVSYPVVAPDSTIYQVAVANETTGFQWEGKVNALMQVMIAPQGVLDALTGVLATIAREVGQQTPALGLWTEERTTPPGLLGSESFEYRSGDWLVAISYPVVAPDQTVYHVEVANSATGFQWEGQVDANGQVSELAEPEGGSVRPPEPPAPSDEDLVDLVSGNTGFAFDLYQILRQEQTGNLFYSPYSISAALAMTYAGARGETERQMAQALDFLLGQDRLPPAFHALEQALASRGDGASGKDGQGFRLNIANALWGQEDQPFLPEFLDVLQANYGAGLQLVDFVHAAEQARLTINDWVSDETEGRIEDLIPAGVLDAATRLVLTNAVYFNAAWAKPFEPDQTRDGAFHLLDGSQVTVPMMNQTESLGYAQGDGYQAVELLYDGGELSMVILLPDAGTFQDFEGSLDAGRVAAILADLSGRQVDLTLPRFEFESQVNLNDALAALGMTDAFTGDADFSGMTGARDLFISAVLHKAFVSVDESGTEAAAATAVVMELLSAPLNPVQVTVDHPFLFLIRDVPTGTILFVGRVVDPSQ